MSDLYSHDKAAWWGRNLQMLREGSHPAPVHVQLILSDLCNQDCPWCAYRMSGYTSNQLFSGPNGERNPNRMIEYEKAKEIIYDCWRMGVQAIQFTGGGEPTVHPRFWELLEYAQGFGSATALVTNGVRLTREKAAPIGKLSWIRVSLDSANRQTYAKIRNAPEWHFDAATEGIRIASASGAVVGVGFVITKDNWHETLDAAKLAKSLGAGNIRIGGVFQTEGASYFSEFGKEAMALAKEAEGLADGKFTVYNRFTEKLADLEQGPPDYGYCGYQRFTTYIGGDLSVYRCCVTSYNRQGFLGSLKDRRFYDMWLSKETASKLDSFDARTCERCQFNTINRGIIKMLEKPPHAEFV